MGAAHATEPFVASPVFAILHCTTKVIPFFSGTAPKAAGHFPAWTRPGVHRLFSSPSPFCYPYSPSPVSSHIPRRQFQARRSQVRGTFPHPYLARYIALNAKKFHLFVGAVENEMKYIVSSDTPSPSSKSGTTRHKSGSIIFPLLIDNFLKQTSQAVLLHHIRGDYKTERADFVFSAVNAQNSLKILNRNERVYGSYIFVYHSSTG